MILYEVRPYGLDKLLVFSNATDTIVAKSIIDLAFGINVRVGLDSLLFPGELPLSSLEKILANHTGSVSNQFGKSHIIEVDYAEGLDTQLLSEITGLAQSDLIKLHRGTEWVVALIGFAPGFPYLRPKNNEEFWDRVPRLPSPRVKVPIGSVGLAAGMSCIYPVEMPGGWHVIGKTNTQMFNKKTSNSPSLLSVGDTVVFKESH